MSGRAGVTSILIALTVACADPAPPPRGAVDACANLSEITQVVGARHEVLVYEGPDGNRYTVKDTEGRLVAECAAREDLPWGVHDSVWTVVRLLETPQFGYLP